MSNRYITVTIQSGVNYDSKDSRTLRIECSDRMEGWPPDDGDPWTCTFKVKAPAPIFIGQCRKPAAFAYKPETAGVMWEWRCKEHKAN